ncbi:hypothetical protein NTC87_07350, partial [Stenotrophomonas geniculata]|nr:hypothetical protein [Stenotrophomonas geniculata]
PASARPTSLDNFLRRRGGNGKQEQKAKSRALPGSLLFKLFKRNPFGAVMCCRPRGKLSGGGGAPWPGP